MSLFRLTFCTLLLLFCQHVSSQDCNPPANLFVTNVTDSSVTVSWDASTDPSLITYYRINIKEYNSSYPSTWYDANIPSSNTSYTIDQLNSQTQYEIKMKSVCGNVVSQQSSFVDFYTSSGCMDPLACNYDPNAVFDNNSCLYDLISFESGCSFYVWNNNVYNQTGTYYFPDQNSCPKEILNLTILNNETFYDTILACDSYEWHNTNYTQSGDYIFEFTTSNGCDSLVALNLTINNSSSSSQNITACDSFDWNEVTYTESGTYNFETTNAIGCDSISTLNLIINSSYSSEDNATACDSFVWNGVTYIESGTYTFETTTVAGCDSTANLNLTINNSSFSEENVTACDSFVWNGVTYTESGNYSFTTTNVAGCDSIATLNLTIAENDSALVIETCNSFEWNDSIYYESGVYTQVFTNSDGCDSTVILNLTLNSSDSSNVIVFESAESYDWNGDTYFESGTYVFDTSNVNGCDSTVTLSLFLSNTIVSQNEYTICHGDTVEFYAYLSSIGEIPGFSYKGNFKGNHYYISDESVKWSEGDSIAQSYGANMVCINSEDENNFVNSFSSSNIWIGLSNLGDSLVWVNSDSLGYVNWNILQPNFNGEVGFMYGTDDPINDPIVSDGTWALGSDIDSPSNNIPTFAVIEFPNLLSWSYDNSIISNNYSITVNPTQSSTYYTSYLNAIDSVMITVLDTNIVTENVTSCNNYFWNDSIYFESGTYEYITSNTNGCDSTVILELTINPSHYNDTLVVYSCSIFEWNGELFTESGLYEFSTFTTEGCDSVVYLDLTISNDTLVYEEYVYTCEESFSWYGNEYNESGVYEYFIESTDNSTLCDSLFILNLEFIESYNQELFVYECSDSYEWNQETYTESGVYYLDTTSVYGCDSTITLNLWFTPILIEQNNTTICKDDTIMLTTYQLNVDSIPGFNYKGMFNGSHYFLSNFNTTWTESDSIAQQYQANIVSINSAEENTFVSNLTSNNIWLGLTNQNNIYSWHTSDSVDYLNWSELQPFGNGNYSIMYGSEDPINSEGSWALAYDVILPSNDLPAYTVLEFTNQLTWTLNGQEISSESSIMVSPNEASTYFASYNNCVDSVTIFVSDTSLVSIQEEVCNSYNWNDSTYFQSGIYSHTALNSFGCDSTTYLDLIVYQSTFDTLEVNTCDLYEWNNQIYSSAGTYIYEYSNSDGCNSSSTLILSFDDFISSTDVVTCDSFYWNGLTYTESGIYTYLTTNSIGCDSTAYLNLTINNSYSSQENITACDSYDWNGTTYTESGAYTFTTTSTDGCDSIATLNLTINNSFSSVENIIACDSYSWNETTYTESGTYTFTTTSIDGCDSSATLNLTINNSFSSEENIIACGSYYWNGVTFFESGEYQSISTLPNGCDSIANLNLTITDIISVEIDSTSCTFIDWFGETITESGVYEHLIEVQNGCDSLLQLNIVILDSLISIENVNFCGPYAWNGEVYSESGTYEFNTLSAFGCDSSAILNLTIDSTTITYGTDSQVHCDEFTWIDGITYTESNNIATFTLVNDNNCDSIVTLDLTINQSTSSYDTVIVCDSYEWNDTTYFESGNYVHISTNVNGCDSLANLDLTISQLELLSINGDQVAFTETENNTYSISNPNASSTYFWNLSNDAGSIDGGNANNSEIIITWGENDSETILCVYEEDEFGCQGEESCITIDVERPSTIKDFEKKV